MSNKIWVIEATDTINYKVYLDAKSKEAALDLFESGAYSERDTIEMDRNLYTLDDIYEEEDV